MTTLVILPSPRGWFCGGGVLQLQRELVDLFLQREQDRLADWLSSSFIHCGTSQLGKGAFFHHCCTGRNRD